MPHPNMGPLNIPGIGGVDDSRQFSTQQRIQMVQTIAEGPIRGLVNGPSSVYFNNSRATPLENGSFTGEEIDSDGAVIQTYGTITFDGTSRDGTVAITTNAETGLNEQVIRVYNEGERLLYLPTLSEFTATVQSINYVSTNRRTRKVITFAATEFDGDFTEGGLVPYYPLDRINVKDSSNNNYAAGQTGTAGNGTWELTIPDGAFLDVETTGPKSTVTISVAYFVEVQEIIDANTIRLRQGANPSAGTYNFVLTWNYSYSANPDIITAYEPIKTQDLSVDFRVGAVEQPPIAAWNGVGGGIGIPINTSIARADLKQLQQSAATTLGVTLDSTGGYLDGQTNGVDGAADATYITSGSFGSSSGTVAEEASQIRFEIRYQRLQTFDSKDGDELSNTARYEMKIRFKYRGETEFEADYRDLFGGIVTHSGSFNAPGSWDHYIDLDDWRQQLGDFIDFEIRIIRLSRHTGLGVTVTGGDFSLDNNDDFDRYKGGDSTSRLFNVTAILFDRFYYPFTAHSAVSFSSTQFPSVPKVSYEVEGKLVKIPSSYTPREYNDGVAVYEDFWDGSFRDQLYYTNNPAWVFYDMLTNPRYGLGEYVREIDIDKYSLYRIAKYCDELVDDGKGGTEPRYTANIFLAKATDAYKVLKDMATTFVGLLYWMDGQVTAVADVPTDPVYNFSKANVIEGDFSYQSTGNKTKANQIIVTWNDPEQNYEPVPLIIEDKRAIVKEGRINTLNAVAFGATSEGQATRYGRWKLWTAQNQTEIVSFKTALNAAFLRPGDVINVTDADRYGSVFAGRVNSSTSSTVTLDREIVLNSNATYTLNILTTTPAAYNMGNTVTIASVGTVERGDTVTQAWVGSAGRTLQTIDTEEKASNAWSAQTGGEPLALSFKPFTHVDKYTINNTGNTTSTLALASGTFSVNPTTESVWSLNETLNGIPTVESTQEYKIISITQQEENVYGISAVEYYPEKYEAVDNNYGLGSIPDRLWFIPEEVPAPRYAVAAQTSNPNTSGDEVKLLWDAPLVRNDAPDGNPEAVTEEEFKGISAWEIVHNVPGYESPMFLDASRRSQTFTNIPDGFYKFDVRIISSTDNRSPYKTTIINIKDPFAAEVPRITGIAKGGTISTTAYVQEGLENNGIWRTDDKIFAIS